MKTYSFSTEAIQDLDQICQYIAQNDQPAASKIFDAIRKKHGYCPSFPIWVRLTANLPQT
jgi:toxin ParE1/3/4